MIQEGIPLDVLSFKESALKHRAFAVTFALVVQLCLAAGGPLTFAQSGTGTILGRVRNADGSAAAGVQISMFELPDSRGLADAEAIATATTEGDGRYRVTGIAASRYAIFTNVRNALSLSAMDFDKAPHAVVRRGVDVVQDLSLPPVTVGVTVSGRVNTTEADGDWRRVFLSTDGRQYESEVEFDGTFSFQHVPPGDYNLAAHWLRFVWSSKEIRVRGEDVRDIQLHPQDRVAVQGRVITEGGGPSPQLWFSLSGPDGVARSGSAVFDTMRSNGMVTVTGWADRADDVIFITNLPLGEYRIALAGLPPGYRVKSFTYGNTNLLESPLRLGGEIRQLSIVLDTTDVHQVKVRGRLIRDAVLPRGIASNHVTLQNSLLLTPIETLIGPDGSFEFSRIPPGRYAITAPLARSVLSVSEKDANDVEIKASRLRVLYDEAVRRVAAWRPPVSAENSSAVPQVTLQGRIRAAGSAPLFGVRLLLRSLSSKQEIDVAFNDRVLERSIPAGEYRVWVMGVEQPLEVQSLSTGTTDLLKEPLRISPGSRTEPVIVSIGVRQYKTVRVTGRVAAGAPGLEVVLAGRSRFTAIPDPAGAFVFDAVDGDIYSLGLAKRNSPSYDRGIVVMHVAVGEVNIDGIEVALPPPRRTVRGRVEMEGRYPLPAFMLAVRPNVDSGPPFLQPMVFRTSYGKDFGGLIVDNDGRFTLELPEGRHRLRVEGPPESHQLRSVTYGSANLLEDLLDLEGGSANEIVIRFSEAPRSRWVALKGRVTGLANVSQPVRIALVSTESKKRLELSPKKDGSFEFPRLAPDTYTLLTEPRLAGVSPQTIVVSNGEAPFLNLALPGQRRLVLRIPGVDRRLAQGLTLALSRSKTEGYSIRLDMPFVWRTEREFVCSGDTCTSSMEKMLGEPTVLIPETADGEITLTLPDGEYQLRLNQVPSGYTLASFTNGSVDLLLRPLRVGPDTPRDLTIGLSRIETQ